MSQQAKNVLSWTIGNCQLINIRITQRDSRGYAFDGGFYIGRANFYASDTETYIEFWDRNDGEVKKFVCPPILDRAFGSYVPTDKDAAQDELRSYLKQKYASVFDISEYSALRSHKIG